MPGAIPELGSGGIWRGEAMIDLQALRQNNPLPVIAARVVRLRQTGRDWTACCPFHPDRTPSFTIYDGGQRFKCFGCGAGGDVLDFVRQAYGLALPEAIRLLDAGALPRAIPPKAGEYPPAKIFAPDRMAEAQAIWRAAIPAAGTLAEVYLRGRAIDPPYPATLRFAGLPYGKGRVRPCLVCAVRDPGGEVTGIQRIWLADDGRGKAAVPKPKLSLGRVRGGAIRLGELDGTGSVTVCEGPEDGLSLATMLGRPVWVAAGASFLPAMQFPPEVQSVLIGADNDPAGRDAADKAARAYAGRGLAVRILRPLPGFKDFNDELRGERP